MKKISLFLAILLSFAICTDAKNSANSHKTTKPQKKSTTTKMKNQNLKTPFINLSKAVITQSYSLNGTPITEGYIPFGQYQTHFRIAGEITAQRETLLLLHGGPGSTHNYFEVLDHLALETGRMLISYDQLGCGESYLENHPELWVAETWVAELENLVHTLGLKRFHLLGQSWGGMLAITYLAERTPKGVASLILSSSLSDAQLWGQEQHRMARQLPADEQLALREAESSGNYTSPSYLAAIGHYMQLHCNDQKYDEQAPECLRRTKRLGLESYLTAWGPNELTPTGTLAHWNYTDKLPAITTPALIISGTEDLCTPLIAKTMADKLPHSTWELIENCRHLCFVDQHDTYCGKLTAWMSKQDK